MSEAPGTYTGADGREYRWRKFGPDVVLESITDVSSVVPVALAAVDIPAAKAALDALVEAEADIVELTPDWRMHFYSRDPQRWDLEHKVGGKWVITSECGPSLVMSAYHAGAAEKQQESADLRDAAQGLVRTINAMPSVTFDCSVLRGYHLAEDVRVDVNARQLMRCMDTLDKAARELEGKL